MTDISKSVQNIRINTMKCFR